MDIFDAELTEHERVVQAMRNGGSEDFLAVCNACADAIATGQKILFFGNGGSAADAQHIVAELVVRLKKNRKALPAIACTTNTSTMTAMGNDYGFDGIFAREVEALGHPKDIAVGISTSGTSPNVIRGIEAANAIGLITVALTGNRGGQLVELADHAVIVPSENTARIQEMHILLGHILCSYIEAKLGLV